MSEIKTSLIFPAKSRIDLLENLFEKTIDRAKNPDSIEYCIAYDYDDLCLKEELLKKQEKFNVQLLEVNISKDDKTKNIHKLYYAPLSQIAKGKYILSGGNDIELVTDKWDDLLENEAENFLSDKPDRLLYVLTNHGALPAGNHQTSTGFPIFSREHCQTVGTTVVKEPTSWAADQIIYEIYLALCQPRILKMPNFHVKHWSIHTGLRHWDDVSDGLCTSVVSCSHEERQWYINRLNERIMNPNGNS